MTVEDPGVIDFVAHGPGRDEALLILVEARQWSDLGLLLPELQAKLNTYYTYVTSGQLEVDYPELAGRRVHIQLRTVHPPGERELAFLGIVSKQHFIPAGIRLSWKVIGEDLEYGI